MIKQAHQKSTKRKKSSGALSWPTSKESRKTGCADAGKDPNRLDKTSRFGLFFLSRKKNRHALPDILFYDISKPSAYMHRKFCVN